jgi:hypothetical protein
MVLIRGQLDAGSAAPLLAAMDHLSAPWPRDDRDALPILDTRTKAQRNTDALTLMARLALGAMDKGGEIDRPRSPSTHPLPGRGPPRHLRRPTSTGRGDTAANLPGAAWQCCCTHDAASLTASAP